MTIRPLTRQPEPWACVRHFTPNWFAVTMGTGVLALVLAQQGTALWPLACALWLLDVVLFTLFTVLFVARLVIYPETLAPMLGHPVQSMFLGAIPMGLATIGNGCVVFGAALWGPALIELAHLIWWLDALLAVTGALLVPYLMFTRQEHALEKLTAVWLLPIVAPEVTAAAAGTLAPHLPAQAAQTLLLTGYALWGISLSLALPLIALVLLRLAIHKLPDVDFAATCWLPLGPLGTGALGLLVLGRDAATLLPAGPLANGAASLGLIGGLALWGAGLWWLLLASACTLHYVRRRLRFNLGAWGFTFPLGVFTLATCELQRQTDLAVSGHLGSLLGVALALIWLQVFRLTLAGLWHGHLFQAPCLAQQPR